MGPMRTATLLPLAVLGMACAFDPVDLDGKGCPCAPGWRCLPEDNVCVPLAPTEAGPSDAGLEAGTERDASTDASAPRTDAAVDAAIDAATDASFDAALDAGPDDTACDDLHAGALHCDGFEGDTEFALWTENRGASHSTERAYRGTASAHASVGTSGRAYLFEQFPPITSGEIYVRTYAYVPSSADLTAITFITLEEASSPWDYARANVRDDQLVLVTRAGADNDQQPAVSVPRDRWFCLELRVQIGTSGEAELLVDGTSTALLTDVDTTRASPWDTVFVGVASRNSTQVDPTELFMDEVVVATTPIGCD